MAAISDNLIHFLGRQYKDTPSKQLEIFKSIISTGLRCSKIQIKFGQGGVVYNQVVCFTDIPLSHCDEHAAVYGKFGIGFKKSFIKNRGGNPARYFVDYLPSETLDETVVENRGLLYLNLSEHFELVRRIRELALKDSTFCLYDNAGKIFFSNEQLIYWVNQQIAIFSFEKETGDIGPARDETREIDLYYKEREWKLVPMQANIISNSVEHDKTNNCYIYKFDRKDVNVIITPNNDMRMEVLKFFLSLQDEADIRLKNFAKDLLPVVTYDDLHKW